MSIRHTARIITLQTLFELDSKDEFSAGTEYALAILMRLRDEFHPELADTSFATSILKNVLSRSITLDDIITRAAPDWPLEKIGIIDRNVLRMGLFELIFGDREDTPPKVAIDEAIELAKEFGGETSGKFVNGVLGAIYKEMGEPGKSESAKRESKSKDKEYLSGALVYAFFEGEYHFALVHDVFHFWTLSKSKVREGEALEDAAVRSLKEEISLDIVIKDKLSENEYIANKPDVGKVVRHVNYFLGEAQYAPLQLLKKTGLDDVRWFKENEIAALKMYPDIKPLFAKALLSINNKQ
jgi:N utilization substance protein B